MKRSVAPKQQQSVLSLGNNTTQKRAKPDGENEAKVATTGLPLAAKMRPSTMENFIGQPSCRTLLSSLCAGKEPLPSLILWGPSGSGKTSFAKIVSRARTDYETISVNATSTGAPELRGLLERARADRKLRKVATLLFLDEIHRLNKAQQDVLLPYVEEGAVTILGCTTENPSFEVNGALLSRARVVVFEKLSEDEVVSLLRAAIERPTGLNGAVKVDDATLRSIAKMCDGDARIAFNTLEMCAALAREEPPKVGGDGGDEDGGVVDDAVLKSILQRTHIAYSKETHHDLISALHKSIRGGDANAAVYYTMRMLRAGDDPLYLARRFIRAASEDIGLADPTALPFAVATWDACQRIGAPECHVNLAHCSAVLALAPKSVHVYKAMKAVSALIQEESNPPIPIHICNAPTQLMQTLGYGHDYVYTPDAPVEEEALAQTYLPDALSGSDWLKLDTLNDRTKGWGQQWKK